MVGQVVLMGHMSELIHFREREILRFGNSQHSFALGIIEELTLLVEQLEGIPLFGVMAGCEDDTACCLFAGNRQFGGRRSR